MPVAIRGTWKPRGAMGPGHGLRLVTHGHSMGDRLTCQSLELNSLTSAQRSKLVSKLLPNECFGIQMHSFGYQMNETCQ